MRKIKDNPLRILPVKVHFFVKLKPTDSVLSRLHVVALVQATERNMGLNQALLWFIWLGDSFIQRGARENTAGGFLQYKQTSTCNV